MTERTGRPARRWHVAAAAAVLLFGLAASAGAALLQDRATHDARRQQFDEAVGSVSDLANLRLGAYEQVAIALQALTENPDLLTPSTFRILADRLEARGRLASLEGVALLLRQPGPSGLATGPALPYVHPASMPAHTFGFEGARPVAISRAIQTAIDTGELTLSAPVPTEGGVRVVMYGPVYHPRVRPQTMQQRRDAAVGLVAVAFRPDFLLGQVLRRNLVNVAVELHDSTGGRSERFAVRPARFRPDPRAESRSVAVPVAGRLWTLRVHPLDPAMPGVDVRRLIFTAGAAISVLLSLLLWLIGRGRDQALAQVDQAVTTLRRSEQRFRSLASSSPLGIFQLGAGGACEYSNDRLQDLARRSSDELLGDGLLAAFHADDRQSFQSLWRTSRDAARPPRQMRLTAADGSTVWVRCQVAPVTGDDDAPAGWVGSIEDVTSEVEAQRAGERLSAELAHQARHDDLTSLPNRTYFLDRVDEELAHSGPGNRVCVLFLDVDRFKVVNDSLGHRAGDRLLMALAGRLNRALRPSDFAGRFGGDELVACIVGITDERAALAAAERVLAEVNGAASVDGHEVDLTVSIGVALATGDEDSGQLLLRADAAMYEAKRQGKSRCALFTAQGGSAPAAGTLLDRERDLRRGISAGEFVLHYQPIVSVGEQKLVAAEALVRWEHPSEGLLLPGAFIDLAEDSGLILPLGEQVLQMACRQLAQWQRDFGGDAPYVTANVSARQLFESGFVHSVRDALNESGASATGLCLELTESALLRDLELAARVLNEVHDLGVRIAVDDFGTGYSSLTHLRHLPLDTLKIDRSFVSDVGTGRGDSAIVTAVVRLAKALGLTSVAEGVEHMQQAEWLASAGCDLLQGFLLARPGPAEQVTAALRSGGRLGTLAHTTLR